MPSIRISFIEAIQEPMLLKPWWERSLSRQQQTALKIMYGCPLNDKQGDDGFSELDYWAMLQGKATYDDLGYLVSVTPLAYEPFEYSEAWAIVGVRSGKTSAFAATITVYEAMCGGHELERNTDRPLVCFQVGQDLRLARYSLHSVKAVLDAIPFAVQESWIKQVTADRIDLKNGVTIATTPPTLKSIRGFDSPCGVLDEVGVWSVESDSANPDFEVFRQLSSRQAQFSHPKLVGISSPWATNGLLYDRYMAGTNGSKLQCPGCRQQSKAGCVACASLRRPHQGRLVLHSTSAGLGNPLVQRNWLVNQQASDPRAFARECLAVFSESISGFLDAGKIEEAVQHGRLEIAPEPGRYYVAAIDPAFRRDAFALAVCHADPKLGIVQDVSRRWLPTAGQTLNPETLIATEIAPLLKRYNVMSVNTDQFNFASLQQIALQHGLSLEETPFSAGSKVEVYGSLKALVNTGRIKLLDVPEQTRELKQLEAKLTPGGMVQISAPEGQHDDLATVIALAAHKAIWMLPAAKPAEPPPETLQGIIAKQVQQKHTATRFMHMSD